MEGIKIFERQEFGQVRVVDVNGEPWFVARDVAKALGYQNTVEAVNTHCKKVNDFRDSKMLPSATPMKIIPESDVYRLVMRSNLPDAERFSKIGLWKKFCRPSAGLAAMDSGISPASRNPSPTPCA